ncbi:hypothetical protein [Streptococcus cristatus]|uniref:Uncharacterized protein n=1 Tax=Streptococcus cristatus TaxID=45634 RepID=A0A139N5Q5_STRCR|nr:hypothetical protein [Streptococcus cristatus]KXT71137.1 hypothetical protein SCRDD08_00151 [Streptococcus cristatus]
MSYSVKAHNLGGIQSYGESITSFSVALTAAAAQTQRSFTDRVGGQKGEVINAFFGKLNILQDQVFQQAPEALKTYGEGVSEFSHTVQGLGFSKIAHTDKGEINNIVNTLSGPQYDDMIAKKNGLKSLMEEAQEALGNGTVDFTGYEEKAQGFIDEEIKARNTTHQGISDADDALKKVAETGKASFEGLADIIQNAQAIIGVGPEVIYDAIIKTNNMTIERLNYLDNIMSKEDSQMVRAILTDDIEAIMNIDSSKISKTGYKNMAIEVRAWFTSDSKGEEKMNRLLASMENKTKEKVKEFSTNTSKAMNILKNLHGGTMREYEKQNPNDKTSETWLAYEKELNHMNEASGVLAAIRTLKIGSSHDVRPRGNNHYKPDGYDFLYDKRGLQIRRGKNGEWDLVVTEKTATEFKSENSPVDYSKVAVGDKGKEKIYNSHLESGYIGQLEGEFVAEAKKLDKELQEADKEFAETLSKNGVKGLLMYVGGPAAVAAFDTLDALGKVKLSDSTEGGLEFLEEITSGKVKKKISGKSPYVQSAVDSIQGFLEQQEKKKEIAGKLDENTRKFYGALTGQGVWQLKDGEDIVVQDPNVYMDYGSTQRTEELNNQGIVGYVEYQMNMNRIKYVKPGDTAQDVISQRFEGDEAMKEYLLGNSDLDISQMSPDQLQKLARGIEKIVGKNALTGFEMYMSTKYGA